MLTKGVCKGLVRGAGAIADGAMNQRFLIADEAMTERFIIADRAGMDNDSASIGMYLRTSLEGDFCRVCLSGNPLSR